MNVYFDANTTLSDVVLPKLTIVVSSTVVCSSFIVTHTECLIECI